MKKYVFVFFESKNVSRGKVTTQTPTFLPNNVMIRLLSFYDYYYYLRCAPPRRPSLLLSVLLSEKVIARASLTSAHSRLRRSWPYLIPNRYLMPNRYAHPGLLGWKDAPRGVAVGGGQKCIPFVRKCVKNAYP